MDLTAIYVAPAMLLAPSIFVAAEWTGHERSPRPPHRVMYSILAAALWPLLVVGLAQFAVIVAVRRALVSRSSGPAAPMLAQPGDDADTAKLPRLAASYVGVRMGTPAT